MHLMGLLESRTYSLFARMSVALVFFIGCAEVDRGRNEDKPKMDIQDVHAGVELIVLGNVQDAGSPQIGCQKSCCTDLFSNPDPTRKVVSLGLIDYDHQTTYLFDASPDLPSQIDVLNEKAGFERSKMPDGVFLTHAHIGHYTGLMYFGKEAINSIRIPVYAMPRMHSFLSKNGPWSQLVANENIVLKSLLVDSLVELPQALLIQPLLVPHRDEFSETVGFLIKGPSKSALYIPDIDKWERWDKSIVQFIKQVDFAFIDGTFFDGEELNNRPMDEVPHPFIVESMNLFQGLSQADRAKIYFIHFNHTNPLLIEGSNEVKQVEAAGYHIARFGMRFKL